MTLRGKLLLAQLPLALSLLATGAVSRRTVRTLDQQSQEILKDNYQSVLAAGHMRDAADAMARLALARARDDGRPLTRAETDEIERSRALFERELAFQEGNLTETGEREMTASLRRTWDDFQRQHHRVIEAGGGEARARWLDELQPALAALSQATSAVTAVNQDAMVRKSDRARRTASQLGAVLVGVDVTALVVGILASVWLTRRLTRPLAVLSQAVRRLGQGDLAVRARLDSRDEIGQVAADFNRMAERLAEYRQSSIGELLAAQEAAQAVIDSLPDPVVVLTVEGTLLNHNAAAESALGVSLGAGGGLPEAPPPLRELIERLHKQVTARRAPVVPRGLDEAVAIPSREGPRHLLPRAAPVLHADGTLAGVAIVLQDVTRLRRFDELKNDLVATVAHEFRTPLTSLRMATWLLAEGTVGPLNDKQADLLHAAREDSERLQGIVDDLLDLSRIQAGRLELHARPVTARALLDEALEERRAQAAERAVALTLAAGDLDVAVRADPERVRLVLGNLVDNALRYAPRGGAVTLAARREGGAVRLSVSDSGPGIAAEHQGQLFDRFYRVPGSPPGGAGLGLYIAREIVEAHGGRIGVESRPGAGATFWFTLPEAPPSATEA